jgi:hypothetical protein
MKFKDAFPQNSPAGFGDRVRIKTASVTETAGLAGKVGIVYGQTVPSSSGVKDIIGVDGRDYAINVFFENDKKSHWFASSLIEFVDHAPGTTISLKGAPTYLRTKDGSWVELRKSRPWWKFW